MGSKLKDYLTNMSLTLQRSSKCWIVMGESAWVLPAIYSTTLLHRRKDCHLTVICIHTSSHADRASAHRNLSLKIFKAWIQHDSTHAGCVTKQSKVDCGVLIKATDSSVVYGLRTAGRLCTHTFIGWTWDGRSESAAWQEMCDWKKSALTSKCFHFRRNSRP